MSEEFKILSTHILDELKRFDHNHERIFDKLTEQGVTLVRNTMSLEEHVRRTNLLETKMIHVEDEVGGLKTHVERVNLIFNILKPTKQKLKILAILASLAGGGYQLKDTSFSKVIQSIEKVIK